MNIKEELIKIFETSSSGPFLFLGSGFSRRYLDLEDWEGLIKKFCLSGHPFEYYRSIANNDNPKILSLLASDFNKYWWSSPDYENNVRKYSSEIKDESSALKLEISEYLKDIDKTSSKDSQLKSEIELLASLNVDGVITTNWDLFIEQLFPEYKVFVGQEELLFSNPQEIGEIYKIHGCSTVPSSLVLTSEDYLDFNEKNTYLAAKLITLFVEHPIVFIGYSISDKNISSLLKAISSCIGIENIEKLRKNLIFVQRLKEDESSSISDTYITIDGIQIPLVLIKTNDYKEIYESINITKRKIPARVLRYCKEQLYELVQSSEPEKKISVIDIDEIESKEDVEFLVGVGVAQKHNELAEKGYATLNILDLMSDILNDDKSFDTNLLLTDLIPNLCKNTKFVPAYKYLNQLGINSNEDYKSSIYSLDKIIELNYCDLRVKGYDITFKKNYLKYSLTELIEECTAENAAAYIPCLDKSNIDLDILKEFILDNFDKLNPNNSSYASNFKKLVVLYDKVKWGWE